MVHTSCLNPPRKSSVVWPIGNLAPSHINTKMDEDLAATLQNILDQAPSHQTMEITLEISEMDILWR